MKKLLSTFFCLTILVLSTSAQTNLLTNRDKTEIATEILKTSNLEPSLWGDAIAKINLSSKNLPKDFLEFKLENKEILFNIFDDEDVQFIEYYQFDKFEIKNKEALVTFSKHWRLGKDGTTYKCKKRISIWKCKVSGFVISNS